MKAARLLVLAVALIAGGGAAYMMMGKEPPPPPPVQIVAPAPETDGVLVASRDLPIGAAMSEADMRWQPWPIATVPPSAIRKSQQAGAPQELKGYFVRSEMLAGEPLVRTRLSKDAGFMSGALPAGMRAVAIDLADQGKSAAGGFILPNDRVDVLRTYHPEDTPNTFASETIVTNVRVLAVGQAQGDKATEHSLIGTTATLELTPNQAERVILGQRTGQLTLILRSVADASHGDKPSEPPQTVTVVKIGNASILKVR